MSEAVHFSFASEKDIPELEKLVNGAYRGDSSKKGWTTEADLLDGIRTDGESLKEMIQQDHSVILKCSDEKQTLLGCVYLQRQGVTMYLGMLTVSPHLQARGIGKELLKAAEDHAISQGCEAVTMTVITARTELINWYEKRGYYKTGEKKPFPAHDPRFGIPKQALEFLVMEKKI
jgi:ribosomal protein S18 acetylase RimI-like enzyme